MFRAKRGRVSGRNSNQRSRKLTGASARSENFRCTVDLREHESHLKKATRLDEQSRNPRDGTSRGASTAAEQV